MPSTTSLALPYKLETAQEEAPPQRPMLYAAPTPTTGSQRLASIIEMLPSGTMFRHELPRSPSRQDEQNLPGPIRGLTQGEKENRIRLKLLAREFARSGLSLEDQARLEIASQRVQILYPRITEDHYKTLETCIQGIDSLREMNAEIERELGEAGDEEP